MNWLRRLWERIRPKRVMCPTCLGDGCVECHYRGDIPTLNTERQEGAGRG